MIEIIGKQKCSGCAACASICPVKCISMEADSEGFLYPKVDSEKCIHCNGCDNVCPIKNTSFCEKSGYPEAYLGYSLDQILRTKSAAGGGFGSIAKWFLQTYNGVVIGAAYDDSYHVKHICIEKIEELWKLQKSKYVQSEIGNTFLDAKRLLKDGRYVLFSGTPCQVYGLKSYLKNTDDSRLLCVDFSCHGVPSPMVLEKYLNYLENKNGKIKSFVMRDKIIHEDSYVQGFGIEFDNGSKIFNTHTEDLYGRCFWGEIASRPSCYECHFKTVWRAADITLGDCWFFNCFVPQECDNMGVTMFLAQNQKGSKVIEDCDLLKLYSVSSEQIIKANGGMIYNSALPNINREVFFDRLNKDDFCHLVNELTSKPKQKNKNIRLIMEKTGLKFSVLKRLRRRKLLNQRLKRVIPKTALGEMK